jgi:hypothetical protein
VRSLGTHLADFFLQVHVLFKSVVNGAMSQSKLSHCHKPIFLYIGGDIGNKCRFPNFLPSIQLPPISGRFSLLNVIDDGKNLGFLQALVAIHCRHCFFNVFEASSISGESSNKVA